jgi:hypothetical protein
MPGGYPRPVPANRAFARPVGGNAGGMTDEQARTDRHPTDEPDGTPAYEASLRPPGDSVAAGEDTDGGGQDFEAAGDASAPPASRSGYDVDAVAGDTERYRPQ